MKHYFGSPYSPHARHNASGVVPRELAVRLARERDVMARQLEMAGAQMARLEEQVRMLNGRLLPSSNDAQDSQALADARREWEEERASLVEAKAKLSDQLEASLMRQAELEARIEDLSHVEHAESVRESFEAKSEEMELAHQKELTRWMGMVRNWEEDYERLQSRQQRALSEAQNETRRRVLASFLELRDTLTMALNYAQDDTENPWRQGIEQVLQRFDDIVAREGLSAVGKKGERFDPVEHEAIAMIPGGLSGHIAHVEQQGYVFEDGTLARSAKVVVYQ